MRPETASRPTDNTATDVLIDALGRDPRRGGVAVRSVSAVFGDVVRSATRAKLVDSVSHRRRGARGAEHRHPRLNHRPAGPSHRAPPSTRDRPMTNAPDAVPGRSMPGIALDTLGGSTLALDEPGWRAIVVYRGAHCPICKKYLTALEGMKSDFEAADVSLVAISADDAERARPFIEEAGFSSPVGVGLTVPDMQRLGLYVSDPRSPEEAPAPFAEPGLFVVNADGILQIVDVANAPFVRPDMAQVLGGIGFVRDKGYPVRGDARVGVARGRGRTPPPRRRRTRSERPEAATSGARSGAKRSARRFHRRYRGRHSDPLRHRVMASVPRSRSSPPWPPSPWPTAPSTDRTPPPSAPTAGDTPSVAARIAQPTIARPRTRRQPRQGIGLGERDRHRDGAAGTGEREPDEREHERGRPTPPAAGRRRRRRARRAAPGAGRGDR